MVSGCQVSKYGAKAWAGSGVAVAAWAVFWVAMATVRAVTPVKATAARRPRRRGGMLTTPQGRAGQQPFNPLDARARGQKRGAAAPAGRPAPGNAGPAGLDNDA